jgi:DNA helicase HerA-like ATPase
MRPLDRDQLLDVWVEELDARLHDELGRAAPGHCLRVTDLPRPLLERLAARLVAERLPDVEVYLVERTPGPELWRVGVHKVVERRNAEEGIVLALFPPDLQLAAGDSVDISTFRQIPVQGLQTHVEATLLARIPEPVRRRTEQVLAYLKLHRWPVSPSARLSYLAAVAQQPGDDPAAVGGALYLLGLIPDFGLMDRPEELPYRIGQRNIANAQRLREEGTTPLDRVLRLPIANEELRDRLLELFAQYRPEDVQSWGGAVATDEQWRDLALEHWHMGHEGEREPHSLRIDVDALKLPRRKEYPYLMLDATERVVVSWHTDPKPINVPGLAFFRVEVLSADREVVWESPLIKRGTGATARRSRTIRDLTALETGVYFFRVIALDEAGDPFPEQPLRDETADSSGRRTNESDDFLLFVDDDEDTTDDVEPVTNTVVASFAEAETLARCAALTQGKDPGTVHAPTIEWVTPADARAETAVATVQFDIQRRYSLRLSQRLRRVETAILAEPESGGCFRMALGMQAGEPQPRPLRLPENLAHARREVFAAIWNAMDGAAGQPVVALADLCDIAGRIERYAETYGEWLESGDPNVLLLDIVEAEVPEFGAAALMAPTHPLRLLWVLQEQTLARAWIDQARAQGAEGAGRIVDVWRSSLSLQGLPPLLVLGAVEAYLEAGPLPGGWGAYLPPRLHDSRAVLALLRARLGAGAAHHSEADVPPTMLADKLEAFLRQHPYTPALVINVINPGDAALIVDALVELERRRSDELPPVRYVVRLFTDSPHREGVGSAFRALVDPERQISEAADRLVTPGRSFLFPKLTWSRNSLREFIEKPHHFPAHITLLLDAFPIAVRVARLDPTDRSSWVHGLVQEAPRRFVGRGRAYTWIRRPAPTPCPDVAAAPGRAARIAELIAGIGAVQARVLAPNSDTSETTAVAALDLGVTGQSLLYSAHAVSTWVLTLDPHLGLDYFDGARRPERPGYLLDFTPEFVAAGGRQLLLTTRIDAEVTRLMQPAAAQLGLDEDAPGAQLLIEALRSLSGRLALRLLSSPSQVQGALGMALSRLFLDAYGLLDQAIVVPLDAHPELARREADDAPHLRGDLLVVTADPSTRHLDMLLVEVKCHAGTGISVGLREAIATQLGSTEQALREAFDPLRREPDRIDRAVQSWRLAGVLHFYLERAARYNLVTPANVAQLRQLLNDLDAGYTLSVRRVGLVFRLETSPSVLDTADPELPIWVVGADDVRRIVLNALRTFVEQPEANEEDVTDAERDRVMAGHVTWDRVRSTFGGPTLDRVPSIRAPGDYHGDSAHGPVLVETHQGPSSVTGSPEGDQTLPSVVPAPMDAPASPSSDKAPADAAARVTTGTPSPPTPESAECATDGAGPRAAEPALVIDKHPSGPEYAVLLGESRPTPQYGLLGTMAAEPWRRVALDLNGCNTISVFGVQGSGKSYTVGSIVEMATVTVPGLNALPRPLGAVVFHYHQTQDYPPEFVSMDEPNDDPAQVAALAEIGVAPAAVSEVLVLTTADMVELRRREFPRARVEPIAFASRELTVADWRFLMGATGNDALYLKLLNEVMRRERANLTLEAIRSGIASAPLSDSQRALAETRLEFAARFIDDTRSLRSLFQPGRLVVVDLRDEFIEKDQALGLFVTMLNVFSGAGLGSEPFNKVIVFDEAHKYMGGALIGQVVEVIREMRHKGVSVIIASQDPINVPPAVIELSSAVVLHRFNSPTWLRHIQRSLAALGDLTPSMLASLNPGEAFVWANKATDAAITRRAAKLRLRPRVTKHSGSTRTAIST